MAKLHKGRTLSGKDWIKIRSGWESGTSVSQIVRDFGVNRGSIYLRAKKESWKARGAAITEAIAKAEAKLERTYEDIATEVCDKHLDTFRALHDLARANINLLIAETKAIGSRNKIIVTEFNRQLEEGKTPPPLATQSTSRIIYAMASLSQTVRMATIEGERLIMGLMDHKTLASRRIAETAGGMLAELKDARKSLEGKLAAIDSTGIRMEAVDV